MPQDFTDFLSEQPSNEGKKKDFTDFLTGAKMGNGPDISGMETFEGDSDYDEGLTTGYNQGSVRAYNQPWYDEMGNALGRAALNIVPSVIGNFASIFDFEDYANQDKEVGNAITRSMEDLKQQVNKDVLPIYRENPGESLDIGDSAWWMENGGQLIESAGSFLATGGIVGRGLSLAANLAKLGQSGQVAAQLLTAGTLNQAESIPSAMKVYDTVLQKSLNEGLNEEEAKQKAADAASYTININRLNIPLNLTSSLAFLRSPKLTRQTLKDISLRTTASNINKEGMQEGLEEIVNLVGEREGIKSADKDYKYDFNSTLKDVFSKEGLESALLGYVGGAIQTGGQTVLNNMSGETSTQRERYLAQQNYIKELDEISNVANIPSLASTFKSVKEQADIHNKIKEAADKGDLNNVRSLQNTLLETQAFTAFTNQSADKLEDSFRKISQLTTEEAAQKGLDINPSSEDFYKKRSQEAIQRVKKLEDLYLKVSERVAEDKLRPIYDNRIENENILEEIEKVDLEVVQEQGKSLREINAGLGLTQTSNYEYLGELQKRREALNKELKKNAENYRKILSEPVTPEVKPEEKPEIPKEGKGVTKGVTPSFNDNDIAIINEFEDTVFNSTEELEAYYAQIPDNVKESKKLKTLKKGKLQKLELDEIVKNGTPLEVKKGNKKVTAVAIPKMYMKAAGITNTHIEIINGKAGATFTPGVSKTDTFADTTPVADNVVTNAAPEDMFDNIPFPDEPSFEDVADFLDPQSPLPNLEDLSSKTGEKKTKVPLLKKQKEISAEIKNKDQQYQLTIDKEEEERVSGISEKIGYDYSRLNNPNHLNGKVRLTLDYVEGINAPFIFVEEKNEEGKWIRVSKLIRTLTGVSNDIKENFQKQFDTLVERLKTNNGIITKVIDKKLDNYLNVNKNVKSGLDQLLTNDRAKSVLPDGEIYIGTVQGGVPQVREINNSDKGGTVALGKNAERENGRHFLVLLAPTGELVPAYLQDTLVKDIEVDGKKLIETVSENINKIREEFLASDLPKDQKSLNSFWNKKRDELITPIVNVNRDGFHIGLSFDRNSFEKINLYLKEDSKLSEAKIMETIGNRFFNIEVKKLTTDKKYTDYLVNNRILTTDLNTERPIVGTQLKIDVSFLSEERLIATESETTTPEEKNNEAANKRLKELEDDFNPFVDPSKINDDLFTKLVFERDYKQLNIEEEKQWLTDNLPQIPVETLSTTTDIAKKFGVEAHGIFTNAVIYLAENGMEGTAYHEAFHAVFNLYIPEKERVAILEQYAADNADLRTANTSKIEEKMAEDFREYMINEGTSKVPNIVSKFFKDLLLWIKNKFGLFTVNDLFYQIKTGKFANSPVKNFSKDYTKYKIVEGFNPIEQRQRINTLVYQVFNGLRKAQNVGTIISIDTDAISKEVYNKVWTDIKEMWDLRESTTPHPSRKKVIDNWNEFKELTTKDLARFGFKVDERILSDDVKQSEDTKERIYDLSFFKSSLKDTVSREIKLFIATIPEVDVEGLSREQIENGDFKYKKDELGNPVFIDFHEMFNYLSKELSGIGTIEGMTNKLEYLSVAKPQLHYIINILKKSPSVTEAEGTLSNNFRNKFFTTFRNQYIRFLTVRKRVKEYNDSYQGQANIFSGKKEVKFDVFETNKRGIDRVIISKWKELNKEVAKKDVFSSYSADVRKNAKALDTKNNFEILKVVQDHLNSIGIDVSLPALRLHKERYFRLNYNGDRLLGGKTSYSNHLLQAGSVKGFPTIGQIFKSMTDGRNVFGEGEELGEYTVIKDLAKLEASVNSDITNGSFLNGENEMVYAINSPTFASNRITELKENINGILENHLGIPFFRNNKIINDLVNDSKFREEFDLFVFDTFTDDTVNKGGIAYDQTQDIEFLISKLNLFLNQGGKYGYFLPPTPADRGNISAIKLPKLDLVDTPIFINGQLNTDSEFYKWLIGSVENEFNRIKQTWEQIESIPENEQILNYHYKIDKEGNRIRGNAFYFNMFHNLNNLLYDDIANPDFSKEFTFDSFNGKEVAEELNKTFVKLFENEKIKLDEKGIIEFNKATNQIVIPKEYIDGRVKDKNKFIEEYIANQFYANTELTAILSGDIAFYKGGPITVKDRKTQFADVDKRFGQSFVPGREQASSVVYSDVAKKTFKIKVGTDVYISNDVLGKINEKYLKNNQSDAQGFITLERLRDIMIGQGLYTKHFRKAWDRVKAGGTDASDINTVFQPIKGFHYAQTIRNGLSVPVQVKYSTIPLIPAFIKDYPELEKLDKQMREEWGVDEFVFESGIKVGRTDAIMELENRNWRIPQVVPYKDTTEERFGSQKRKLIVENIDEEDVKAYYQQLIAKNIYEDFKETAPKLEDIDKVAATILEQLKGNNSKGLPDRYEKALQVIETKYGKDTRISLDNPLIKKRVESIFNSFIDSRVVDQMLPGFSAVQVSTYGQVKKSSDLKFVRLSEDGKTVLPAEVKVSPKYFLKSLKKKKIDVKEFLDKDGNLDIKKIPVELRKFTLHRIPTQGKNSMLPAIITEFTPNEMGSVIFLPVEVTTQAGSDFDIDKVFIEMYNFKVESGKIKKVESGMDSKQARQNAILDIHYNILTNPKYFNELITPNNTDTLTTIKNEIQKEDQMDQFWFSPWLQEEFKSRNQAGKQLVGFYSIASVSHAIAQEIKLQLGLYDEEITNKADVTTESLVALGSPMIRFEGHSRTSLFDVRDIEGNLISDNIAERQTAAVDNAKDPILGYLNDNLFTAPVKALIIRAGYPLKYADYFTVQPIVISLTKAFNKYNATLGERKALKRAITDVSKEYNITDISQRGVFGNSTNFTFKSLQEGLKGNIDHKAVLETFIEYKKLGDELYNLSLALAPDRKGTASTMSENLYNERLIEAAKNNDFITFDVDAYNAHSLAAFEKYGIKEAIKLAKKYFSDGTEVFKTLIDNVTKIKGDPLTVNEIQDLTYNFYTYLHTGEGSAFKEITPEERSTLLKGDNALANRVNNYVKLSKQGKVTENLFLNNLITRTDKTTGIRLVEFNATANQALSVEEKQILEDSILDLYRQGGKQKQLAVDLLKYCFITSGFNRGTNGFIDYIPIEIFEDLGLTDYYRDLKEDFDSTDPIAGNYKDQFNLNRFIDQYVSNNYTELYWVPKLNNKQLKGLFSSDNDSPLPTYYYNRSSKKLMKEIDDNEGGMPDYEEINRLGSPGIFKEYDLNTDISSILTTNNKSGKNQVESKLDEITREKLIYTLEGLSKRFGIKYTLDNTLPVLGRFKDGQVIINPDKAKADTPFHEFVHPFLETIKKENPILYKNLVRQITATNEGKEILNKVKELYKKDSLEDQIDEAIVTSIGRYAVNTVKDSSLLGAIKTFLKRVSEFIREITTGPKRIIPAELDPNMSLEDLGEFVSGEDFIIINDVEGSFDSREIDKTEKIVNDAIQVLTKKILIYKQTGSKGFLEREQKILNDLKKSLSTKQFEKGILSFTTNVRKEVSSILDTIKNIDERGSDTEKARILKATRAYVNSYKNIIEEINDELEEFEEIQSVVKGINEDISKIERRYFKEIDPIFSKFLKGVAGDRGVGKNIDFDSLLTNPKKDISFFQRWLDAVSEASDDAIKLIDKAVKIAKEKARLKSLDIQKDLIAAKKKLEDAGIKDTKFVYETYKGKITGNLVTEFNQAEFAEARAAMYDTINKDEKLSDQVKKFRISKWWKENTQRKGKDFVPSNKYKNPEYTKVISDPTMKEFYDLVWKVKKKSDKMLPEKLQKTVKFLAPQIRKDILERLASTDKSKVKQVLESIKESFTVVEDETDFGQYTLTDEQGKPVNFLPTFFTTPLSDKSELSTDIVATLSSYNYMAEDHGEMNKIIHVLEIGKDIIENRKIDTGAIDPVTKRPILKAGNESNTYARLEDYYNMVVYGKYKLDEGKISGTSIDKAKAIDTFGRYVAINSLALNVFSGISNITFGSAMIRTEAIAGEFIDNKDLAFADKTYATNLPSVLGDIGQRIQNNKLQLWTEKFNTLQDYDQKIKDIDSNRKTIFSRMFKTSSLFFINKAGEHWMQTRMSLALANKFKVKDSKGNEINLWDAMEVKDGKLVPIEGSKVTEEDIIKFTLKQNFLNKRLHGVYNTIDKSAIQKYALGRMAMMFRKFIKPGINRRFEKLTYNEEGEVWTEGYYNTVWRFLGQLKKDLVAGQFSFQTSWNNLTETEKRNMYRTMTEVAYMIGAATLAGILTGLSDDEDENWLLAMSAYQANRLYTELRFYSSISEGLKILKSPAAGVNQIQGIVDFLWVPEWFDEIESGKNAGMTKFERNALKVIPLSNTIRKIGDPEEQLMFYTK